MEYLSNMTTERLDQAEQELLTYAVSDEALEVAANTDVRLSISNSYLGCEGTQMCTC